MIYDEKAARREEETYRTKSARERRQFVRDAISPERTDTIVSIGPGPGFEPAEIAATVDSTSIIGIDRSPAMLSLAKERCAQYESVSLIEGDATAIPLPRNSVDTAIAVQVYGYCENLRTAFSELRRVLRPTGEALVYVTDWETLVWRTRNPDLAKRVYTAWQSHCTWPRLGSTLKTALQKENVAIRAVKPFTICNTSLDQTFSGSLVPEVRDHTAKALGEGTADAWLQAIRDTEQAGETFFSLTGYLYRLRP